MKKPTNATQPLLAAFLPVLPSARPRPVCGLPSPGQALTRQLVSRKTAAEAGPDATPGPAAAPATGLPSPQKVVSRPAGEASRSPRSRRVRSLHHCQPPGEAEGSHGAERRAADEKRREMREIVSEERTSRSTTLLTRSSRSNTRRSRSRCRKSSSSGCRRDARPDAGWSSA